MKEIKFRAKIRNIPQPLYVVTIDFGNCVVCIVDPERCNQQTFDWSEIDTFLMATGLRDKNGKEIYEGDIIQGHPYSLHPVEVYWEQGLCSYEVRRGAWSSHCLDYSGENDMGYQPLEVIGNIYENPELLEGKDG